MRSPLCLTPYVLGLLLCGAPLRADFIIGNLAPTNSGGAGFNPGSDQSLGVGFTIDAGYDVVLESATLMLSFDNDDVLTLLLMSDVGGSPTTVLGGFSAPVYTGVDGLFGAKEYEFTSLSPITLTHSTPYWLVIRNHLGTAGGTTALWWISNTDLVPTGPYATTYGLANSAFFPPVGHVTSAGAWQYQLDGTPVQLSSVPVPSSLALLLTGLPCGWGLRYWRRRQSRPPT